MIKIDTPSGSRDGVMYSLEVHPDGGWACNCPAFWRTAGNTCPHWREYEATTLAGISAAKDPVTKEGNDMSHAMTVRGESPTALAEYLPAEGVTSPSTSVLPTLDEMKVLTTLANGLAKAAGFAIPSSYQGAESAGRVFAVIYGGWEKGIRPMTALQHSFVLDGKTEMDGQLMMAMVLARVPGAQFEWTQDNEKGARVLLHIPGKDPIEGRWSYEDAVAAGQIVMRDGVESKPQRRDGGTYDSNWYKYRRDMFRWAAIKRAVRFGAPEVINAIEGFSMTAAAAAANATAMLETGATDDPALHLNAPTDGAAPDGSYVWADYLDARMAAEPGITWDALLAGAGWTDGGGTSPLDAIDDWIMGGGQVAPANEAEVQERVEALISRAADGEQPPAGDEDPSDHEGPDARPADQAGSEPSTAPGAGPDEGSTDPPRLPFR